MISSSSPELVKLPKTESRRGGFATLASIERVDMDPKVVEGAAWEGKYYKPGSFVSMDELTASHREHGGPVLFLEKTECEEPKKINVSQRKWKLLLVLWRYDVANKCWLELARLMSPDPYTLMEFRKVAHRLLEPETLKAVETAEQSAARLHSVIEKEVKQLHVGRVAVMELLLHYIVSRIVDERGSMEWPARGGVRSNRSAAG